MKTEKKQLLLHDLFARLPHKVIAQYSEKIPQWFVKKYGFKRENFSLDFEINYDDISFVRERINYFKPYLRPMSSMTEEEFKEYHSMLIDIDKSGLMTQKIITRVVDWLDRKMFDHRNLIPMGLALKAREGMYKTE